MKKIVLFAAVLRIIIITALIGFTIFANAQSVAVNTTGTPADASAMLDISSISKGFLPPRMTTVQRTGISSPANGLMVFDTDTKTYWYFATTWKEVGIGGSGNFSLPYSDNSSAFFPFSITNTSAVLGSSAIYGRNGNSGSGFIPQYSMGVWGDNSTGVGVAGTSNTIGVLGMTNGNDPNGIGVMGVSGSTLKDRGAITGANNSSGVGVFGQSSGTDGVAIYGLGGSSNSNSYAGFFRNSNAANTKDVVQIYNQGAGRGLMVDVVNSSNSDDAIEVRNSGTGNFLSLMTGLGEVKTTIAKNGNINTDGNIISEGTVTVKGNKGIVRNTSSNQLRVEVLSVNVPAFPYQHYDTNFGAPGQDVIVSFSTAFSSPPAVYIANSVSGSLMPLTKMIYEVTTTGFKFSIANFTPYDFTNAGAGTFKVVAIGNE
jgi:hypothetical protein